MKKALHTKEKSICFPEKQDTARSWERFGGAFPHFLQGDGVYHCSPSSASLPGIPCASGGCNRDPPPFPPLKQGKEGGNSKAKGKNKTTKYRIIRIFHHLAEGIF